MNKCLHNKNNKYVGLYVYKRLPPCVCVYVPVCGGFRGVEFSALKLILHYELVLFQVGNLLKVRNISRKDKVTESQTQGEREKQSYRK